VAASCRQWGFRSITGGSCPKYHFCRDKQGFTLTKHIFCRDESMSQQKYVCRKKGFCYKFTFVMCLWQNVSIVMTKVLSRQTRVCRNKNISSQQVLSWQAYFCRDKRCVLFFVATKMVLVAAPTNDRDQTAWPCCYWVLPGLPISLQWQWLQILDRNFCKQDKCVLFFSQPFSFLTQSQSWSSLPRLCQERKWLKKKNTLDLSCRSSYLKLQ